jgi:hypothetical protein
VSNGRPTDAEAEQALMSLTSIERVLCGSLIRRQLANASLAGRLRRKYGLEGAVRLCSARAMNVYAFLIGVVCVAFAIAGDGDIAVPTFLVLLLVGLLAIMRVVSAARTGKRWRDEAGNRLVR